MRKLDPRRSQWDTTAELLAGLIEAVDFGNRIAFVGLGLKGGQPDPVKIPRPSTPTNGDAPQERRPATAAEMKAFFGAAATYTP